MLTRPGDMVREFIEGKRVKHYKPILLVFVLAGISTILAHYNGDLLFLEKMNDPNQKKLFGPKGLSNIFSEYYTLMQVISVPLISASVLNVGAIPKSLESALTLMVGFRMCMAKRVKSFFCLALRANRISKSQKPASPISKLAFGGLNKGLKRIVEKHEKKLQKGLFCR